MCAKPVVLKSRISYTVSERRHHSTAPCFSLDTNWQKSSIKTSSKHFHRTARLFAQVLLRASCETPLALFPRAEGSLECALEYTEKQATRQTLKRKHRAYRTVCLDYQQLTDERRTKRYCEQESLWPARPCARAFAGGVRSAAP